DQRGLDRPGGGAQGGLVGDLLHLEVDGRGREVDALDVGQLALRVELVGLVACLHDLDLMVSGADAGQGVLHGDVGRVEVGEVGGRQVAGVGPQVVGDVGQHLEDVVPGRAE